MSSFRRVCGSEKRYNEYHRICEPCDSCNTKRAMKFYYDNEEKILEKKRYFYRNNKEYSAKFNKKRKCKISDLENQINTLTEMIKSTALVA